MAQETDKDIGPAAQPAQGESPVALEGGDVVVLPEADALAAQSGPFSAQGDALVAEAGTGETFALTSLDSREFLVEFDQAFAYPDLSELLDALLCPAFSPGAQPGAEPGGEANAAEASLGLLPNVVVVIDDGDTPGDSVA